MKTTPNRHERKRRSIQRARDRARAAVFWREKFLRSPRITAQGRSVEWPGEKVAPYREVLDRALTRDEIREHLSTMMNAFKKAMGVPQRLMIGTIRTDYDPEKKAYEWTISGENTNPDDPGRTYVRIAGTGAALMKVFVVVFHDRGEWSEVEGVFATEVAAQLHAATLRPGLAWRASEDGGSSGHWPCDDPADDWDASSLKCQVLPFDVAP